MILAIEEAANKVPVDSDGYFCPICNTTRYKNQLDNHKIACPGLPEPEEENDS